MRVSMAGHSKWANIKFRKAAQDKKRGKIFTKLIREITIAAKSGGGDPAANPRLRTAIDKALSQNMTRDTIERARKRGAGGEEDANLQEVRYEGYGPGGVAVIVDCLTDNRNRTVGEVRHAFTKCGGNLGTDGSVAYLFTKQGVLTFAPGSNEEQIMEAALNVGADDVVTYEDGSIEVITTPEQFEAVKQTIEKTGLKAEQAEITFVAASEMTLSGDQAENMVKLQEMLEDLDDVQNVYSNANIPDEIFQK